MAAEEDVGKLRHLYEQIHACTRCVSAPGCKIRFDEHKVVRRVVPEVLQSQVFIIGQALSRRGQRLSGVPWVTADGTLSASGRILDNFLCLFDYTVDPREKPGGRIYAYCSDGVQCYPGPGKGGDRNPTQDELGNCADWLDQELTFLEPEVIVLLGAATARAFFRQYLGMRVQKMADHWGKEYWYDPGEPIAVFAIPHPSYRRRNPEWTDKIYESTAAKIRWNID